MKNALLIFILLAITIVIQAQVSKTLNVTAGSLYSSLTIEERNTITNLKVTGTIDASDIYTMRGYMPALKVLDLVGITIAAYTGQLGPSGPANISYPANTIPNNAFERKGLTSITFPSLVTSIGDYAFKDCIELTTIAIPAMVTSIGKYAFKGCDGLTSVTIPSSITNIGEYAFYHCSEMTSITISKSVIYIGDYAFGWCIKLKSIIIPSSVTSIGEYAFQSCSELISVTIPTSVTSIGSFAFQSCRSLLSIVIPSSVTTINDCTFNACKNLTSVTIPSSVTKIGNNAFDGCAGLTSIYVNAKNPPTMPPQVGAAMVFSNEIFTTCILYVPIASVNAYRAADTWRKFINVVGFIPTGIELNNEDDIFLCPNPVTDGFRVSGLNGKSTLKVLDINGKLLIEKEINNNEYVSISSFQKGVYFAKITLNGRFVSKKIVKE